MRDQDMLVGVIARMSPEKGQEVLIEALSLLSPAELDSVFVVMAGEDSRERGREDLSALARRFRVNHRVRFLGELADVRPVMSELDLGVVTSTRSEAICRVALEYMSFGLPVLASDMNILREIVLDGVNGWTHHSGDARALADDLREALRAPAERRRRGEKGRELVGGAFSLTREIEETLAFYEETLTLNRKTAT